VTDFWTAPGTTGVFYRADEWLDGNPPHVVYRAAVDGSGSSRVAARPESALQSSLAVASGGDHIVVQTVDVDISEEEETTLSAQSGPPEEHLLVDSTKVAAMLGISESGLWRLLSQERVPRPIRLGRRTLWSPEELRRWVHAGCPNQSRWAAMTDDSEPTSKGGKATRKQKVSDAGHREPPRPSRGSSRKGRLRGN